MGFDSQLGLRDASIVWGQCKGVKRLIAGGGGGGLDRVGRAGRGGSKVQNARWRRGVLFLGGGGRGSSGGRV